MVAGATAATSAIAAVVGPRGRCHARRPRACDHPDRAASLALAWVLDQAAETPIGQRIATAARQMLPYVDQGASGSLRRFGLEAKSLGPRPHLEDMAKAELIRQLTALAPDRLTGAL